MSPLERHGEKKWGIVKSNQQLQCLITPTWWELLVQVTLSTGSLCMSNILQQEFHNHLLNIHQSDLFPSTPMRVPYTPVSWPCSLHSLIFVALLGLFSWRDALPLLQSRDILNLETFKSTLNLPLSLLLLSPCSCVQVLSSNNSSLKVNPFFSNP